MTRPIHEYAAELKALQQAINRQRNVSDTDLWHRAIVSLELFDNVGGIIHVDIFPEDEKEFDLSSGDRDTFDQRFYSAVKDVLDYYKI